MDRQAVQAVVVGLLAEQKEIGGDTIGADARLVDDLRLDSLDATELLLAVHQELGVRLDLDSVDQLGTVEEVVDAIVAALGR